MKRSTLLLFALLGMFAFSAMLTGCSESTGTGEGTSAGTNTTGGTATPPPAPANFTPYVIQDSSQIKEYEEGLKIYVVEEGKGELPQSGQNILINYHGMLRDGTVFDSSFDRGSPFSFALGTGQVIRGWDLGIAKLPFGSKAILILPPEIAYGAMARPNIPANSTLVFHVELLGAF